MATAETVSAPAARHPSGSASESALSLGLLLRQMLHYLPGSVLPGFLGLLGIAIFTRVFDAADYGRYALAMSLVMILTTLLVHGLQSGIARYLPVASSPEAARRLKLAASALLLVLPILALSATGVALLAGVPAPWPAFILPGGLVVALFAPFMVLGSVLQAEMRPRASSAFCTAETALKLSCSLALVFGVLRHPAALLWGSALGYVLLVPLMWWISRVPSPAELLRPGVVATLREPLARIASFGMPMVGWLLGSLLLGLGDRCVIQAFRGEAEVGVYGANYQFVMGGIGLLVGPVISASHPFLMRAFETHRLEEASGWLGAITERFAVCGAAAVAGLWVLQEDVARWLLGAAFVEGHVVMPLLLGGLVLWNLGLLAHKPLEFAERSGLLMRLSLGCAGVNLLLNLLFVPRFGYLAAAWTTLASYGLYLAAAVLLGRRTTPWGVRGLPLAAALASIGAGAWTAASLRAPLEASAGPWVGLAGSALVAAAGGGLAVAIAFGWIAGSSRAPAPQAANR